MSYETIEKTINRQLIVDQVASLLYATGVVPHSQEITNIQFGDLFGASTEELSKIKIFTKEPGKVEIERHNGAG